MSGNQSRASGAMNPEITNTYLEGWYGPAMVAKTVASGWILNRDIVDADGRVRTYTVLGTRVQGWD